MFESFLLRCRLIAGDEKLFVFTLRTGNGKKHLRSSVAMVSEEEKPMKYRSLPGLLALLAIFLIALGGCSGNVATSGQKQTQVHVTFSNFAIQSSQTTFSPGISYTFMVTNQGQAVQDFMIVPMGLAPSAMSENTLVMINGVAPGETKTVVYTFPSSTAGQSLEFACFLHQQYKVSMSLPITVTS